MLTVRIANIEDKKLLKKLKKGAVDSYELYADEGAITPPKPSEPETKGAKGFLKKMLASAPSEDNVVIATLFPGQEITVQVLPGKHTFYFENSRNSDASNDIEINIDPSQDYVVEAQIGLKSIAAGYTMSPAVAQNAPQTMPPQQPTPTSTPQTCPGCGAPITGQGNFCIQCGTALS